MFLAEKTVKNYVSNLLAKLGMSRRTEAAVYAARLAERPAPATEGRLTGHREQGPSPLWRPLPAIRTVGA